ncbi:hypothetical protein [Arthrobacter sp. Marseille-P9274]|uniref:hypothetical protein n=1 Tax=Arthrobacter sp. Marseille-P9274 TaxID=2866572 RepID=UPI0021CA46F0|nr:hypothetical protein [Arthrobacter sp. Marseille-P9274]
MKGPRLPYHPYDNLPTTVQLNTENTNSGWVNVAETNTNDKGCAVFRLDGEEQQLYVRATALYLDRGGDKIYTIWFGITPLVGTPGTGHIDLGTGIVYCQHALERCIPGTT